MVAQGMAKMPGNRLPAREASPGCRADTNLEFHQSHIFKDEIR